MNNIKSALEKAKIGDKITIELVLNTNHVLKLGTYTPQVFRNGNSIQEKSNTLTDKTISLPVQIKALPDNARLVIKTNLTQVKTSKTILLKKL